MTLAEQLDQFSEPRVGGGNLRRDDRGRAQREEPHHRAHLEARRRAVRQPQDVVVESVRLVPHLVVVIANPVHGVGDPDEVLEKRERVLLVLFLVVGQDEGNLQHVLAVEGHPGGSVGLLQGPARRERRAPVDRKSTRLNSSHTVISYAVFCLKKKKKKKTSTPQKKKKTKQNKNNR